MHWSTPDSTLRRVGQGFRLARSGAPRLLDALLTVQLIEALALVGSVQAVQHLTGALLSSSHGQSAIDGSIWTAAALMATVAVAGICQAWQPAISSMLGERLAGVTTARILSVAGSIDLTDFDRPEVLDRLKRVEVGSMVRPAQLAGGLGILLSGAVGAVALALSVLAVQPWLALAAVVAAVPLWWAAQRDGLSQYETIRGLSRLERRRMYLAGLLTRREKAAEVRALELTPALLERYEALSRERYAEVAKAAVDRARRQLAARAVGGGLLVLGGGAVVAMLRTGALTVPEAVAAAAAVAALRGRLTDVAAGIHQLQEAAEFVEDHAAVTGALAISGADRHSGQCLVDEPLRTVALRRASLVYPGMTTPALREVDLELRIGEVVALVGANGSGKSTLAALAAGLLKPTSGVVTCNGVDIRSLPATTWRREVSVLLQAPGRYEESLRDNVRFGAVHRPADDGAVRDCLAAAGAGILMFQAGQGLDTHLGREQDDGFELSGGQWQRIALARTFYRGGRLLVLDEPSAPLDPLAESDLVDRLRGSFADRAVLLITHRMAAARVADRVVVLERGAIAEEGTPADLLAAGGPFAEMCHAQADLWRPRPAQLAAAG